MGRDRNDDEPVTESNVEVESSVLAEITINRTGESALVVSADMGSPADSEPRTLEPQTIQPRLSVRGLAAVSAIPGSVPAPSAEAAQRTSPDDEKTTKSTIEARLRETYASDPRAAGVKPAVGPLTPSEPFRVTSPSTVEILQRRGKLSSAAVRAAPSLPDSYPEQNEPTAKRPPHRSDIEIEVDSGDLDEQDSEEETVTDAMRALAAETLEDDAFPHTQSPETTRADAPNGPDEEPEEDTQTDARQAISIGLMGMHPPASSERPGADAAGSFGFALPKNTSELIYEPPATDPMRHAPPRPAMASPGAVQAAPPPAPPPPAPPPPAPPPPVAPPMQTTASHYPPALVPTMPPTGYAGPSGPPPLQAPPYRDERRAALTALVHPPKKKKRGSGGVLALLFFLTVAAAATAVFYSKHRPSWMNRWPLARVPAAAPALPSASASASASAPASASVPDASAPDSASAAAGPPASASASAAPAASTPHRRRRPRK